MNPLTNNDLVVVPFDDKEGRTAGDSSLNTEMYFPYVEGMTVSDVRTAALTKLRSDWDETDVELEEFATENSLNITGGWVIAKRDLDIINGWDGEIGSDSALYRIISMCKQQVNSASVLIIE